MSDQPRVHAESPLTEEQEKTFTAFKDKLAESGFDKNALRDEVTLKYDSRS